MSFAVLHMQKFKKAGVKGIQFHNQRERESKTNPDIDKDKSSLNYDIHNLKPINYNDTVKDIIKNNVVTNRAIRKDAVVMCNFIISSDKNFFENLNQDQQKDFFKKSYDFFKERYGKEKIIAAPVHVDEKTPHMHLSLVPVTEDNKLSAKRLFDRNELRALQDDFPKYMQSQGFDLKRGIDAEGKNKHIETKKLKLMELENKLKDMEQEKNIIHNDLKAFENELKEVDSTRGYFEDINRIEVKYGLLNKGIVNDIDGFKSIKLLAKKAVVLENEIQEKNKIIAYKDKYINDLEKGINKSLKAKDKKLDKYLKLEGRLKKHKTEYDYLIDFIKYKGEIEEAKKYLEKKRNLDKQNSKNKSIFEREI